MFALTPFVRGNRYVAFDPFRELEELEKSFFGAPTPTVRTDIKETETAYILEAELPGFRKEELKLEVQNKTLTISAEHESENENKEGERVVRRERSTASYRRSFSLNGIDTDAIKAAYENGILRLTLPKLTPAEPQTRRIDIA